MVIEVGRLLRCLVLLEVASMSHVLLSLGISMLAAFTSPMHDCMK